MKEPLSSMDSIERAAKSICELIAAHEEWFYAETGTGRAQALRRSEIELRAEHGRLLLCCLSDEGTAIWRIDGWEWTGEKLLLAAFRRMGSESATLELIPRSRASSINALVSATRRARLSQLAELARACWSGSRIRREALSRGARSGQPGRDARILLGLNNDGVAVTGPVALVAASDADAFLSSALIWFARLGERAQAHGVRHLWLVVPPVLTAPLQQRLALLRDELRLSIRLFEIDAERQTLLPVSRLERAELWLTAPARLPRRVNAEASETAQLIMAHAPEAIDVVRARQGETLRFHGLPFARVRRLMGRERVWFGTERERRRLLEDDMWEDWLRLLRELSEHRRAEAADYRHALYRAAPEAWLESLLRRDITRLDPGLRLAPLHAQLRTTQADGAAGGARPVDLLALRRDGRLAVIELKVAEDREHVLQGADYWRRVEAHRRAGNLRRARLFGDAHIADEPPLLYLVAPTLRAHRAFQTLAQAIAPDIRLYRFDLNEDWRWGVRVMRRVTLSNNWQ